MRMNVYIDTAMQIQTKIANWVSEGRDIFENGLGTPYTEDFYKNCVCFWEDIGYNGVEVLETVIGAVTELMKENS